jgi:hypothetical protein
MNMESLTASLHGGLIQRARPAKAPPLREDAGGKRASVVPLRPGDIARARPAPASLVDIHRPAIAHVLAGAVPAVEPAAGPAAAVPPSRRFGLTVRVGAELRERLGHARERTGRTGQCILHDALAAYLAALERRPAQR